MYLLGRRVYSDEAGRIHERDFRARQKALLMYQVSPKTYISLSYHLSGAD